MTQSQGAIQPPAPTQPSPSITMVAEVPQLETALRPTQRLQAASKLISSYVQLQQMTSPQPGGPAHGLTLRPTRTHPVPGQRLQSNEPASTSGEGPRHVGEAFARQRGRLVRPGRDSRPLITNHPMALNRLRTSFAAQRQAAGRRPAMLLTFTRTPRAIRAFSGLRQSPDFQKLMAEFKPK